MNGRTIKDVPHYPVVIIGSGPTGLTLANLLGVYGVRALIVERNVTTVQEPRAVSIDDESLRTMQAAGIIDQVLPDVVPGYGSHYYSPKGICFAKVEPSDRPYGYPRRNAFRQPILEQQLRDALARFPQIDALYGWRLDTYAVHERSVTLQLRGGQLESSEISCDYLVGCDGAASTVRELQGIQLEGTTFDERWLIIDIENNENSTKHTEVFCDRRRPCITLPGPSGRRRFEFKLLPGEADAHVLEPTMVQSLLQSHGAHPAATIRRKVVYRFHARVAHRWSVGRVFFAGDAAHLTPPFAGQGMNSGIRDAHNLAWKLAAVSARQLGPRLLQSYETERRDHVWQMIRLALRMGQVMSPRNYWAGFATQSALLALNIWPPARDYVAQMKYKPKPRFTAGFMVPDKTGGRRTLVGRLFPQPRVHTTKSQATLLDDVLGPGFALVAVTPHPLTTFRKLAHPVWERLDARYVAIQSMGVKPHACGEIQVVALANESSFSGLSELSNSAWLLRPDRYVAARIDLRHPEQTIKAIESLLKSSSHPGSQSWHHQQRRGRAETNPQE